MSDALKNSWGAFPKDIARRYLKSFGHPSEESKQLLFEVLEQLGPQQMKLVDLGCGNANLGEFLRAKGLNCLYTGVDFSDALLEAAREALPDARFICDDVNTLANVPAGFDVACYSHVIEMLPSPESSLLAAKKVARCIVIRFFEPPAERADCVELLEMDVGAVARMPYLRRQISQAYYEMILERIGCQSVDVYRTGSKDQVHVLHFG